MAKVKATSSLDNLSTTGKMAVGLVFVLLIAALYFVVFYGDVESEIGAQQNLIEQKRTELEQAEADKAAYLKDVEEKTRREALAQKQKKILPDEAESPAFLSTLQTVATISGITLSSWTPQDEVVADFYAKVPMRLEVKGRFHQITKFFHGIGQVDRIINIEDITIKTADKAATAPVDKKVITATAQAEEPVDLKVECLATAFRALRPGETPKRGRGQGPHQPAPPAPAPPPAAPPAPAPPAKSGGG
ncbi:MAG TPA: type 4a pilus biogenesis protein PilO [Polyangiaceae bacterium]|jgi:type IV pilus assembly protein PilO|nr:type 4a pilus biogenesis protein PilO [Polyangiaceae bacterium]